MTDVIYLAPLCQEHERMWCEHDAPVDCECIDGPHPWIKYVAAPQQPTQSDALREAVEAERERCAQIAENIIGANQYDTMDTDCYQDTANRIAAAIRNNSPMPYGEAVAYLLKHGKKWDQN